MRKEYPEYTWSLRTLDRRLRYFNISYIDYQTDVDTVRAVVQKEVCWPGQLLAYRAMNQKLKCEHRIKVPRSLGHNVVTQFGTTQFDKEEKEKSKRIKNRWSIIRCFTRWAYQSNSNPHIIAIRYFDTTRGFYQSF